MKTEKESFIVYKEWNSLIESLDDEERLFFYDTLFNFEGEEIPTYQNKHLQAVVNFVFSRVIENNNKYKEKKKTNSENSKKRWDKNAIQNMQSDATAKIAMLNGNVNDNYNNNVNDNVNVNENVSLNDLWIHDERDFYKAQILVRMFDDPSSQGHLPRPFGVFYQTERACYEDIMTMQIEELIVQKGKGDLDKLLRGSETWTIE